MFSARTDLSLLTKLITNDFWLHLLQQQRTTQDDTLMSHIRLSIWRFVWLRVLFRFDRSDIKDQKVWPEKCYSHVDRSDIKDQKVWPEKCYSHVSSHI